MLKVCGYLVLIVVGALLRAWVIMTLWGWFVVAHFHAPAISMPVAYGLACLAIMFQYVPDDAHKPNESESDKAARAVGKAILLPVVSLGLGAIATVWMP